MTLLLLSSFSLEQIFSLSSGRRRRRSYGTQAAVPLEPGGTAAVSVCGGAAAGTLLGTWSRPLRAVWTGGIYAGESLFSFSCPGRHEESRVLGARSLGIPASWQMEIYRMDENLAISGGLADRDFGHWKNSGAAGRKLLYAGGCSYHSPHRFSGYSLPAACGGGG